jgi:hypothetical protein
MEQIVDREDAALFEAIRGAHCEADLGGAHLQAIPHVLRLFVSAIEWNACHVGFPPFLMR